MTTGRGGRWAGVVSIAVALMAGGWGAGSAHAAANPVPLTDAVASLMPPFTGGTKRVCATSGLGIPVRCVDNVRTMPSAMPTASGVTFGHWIFCKVRCSGSLLVHELVHVRQFETYGDTFGPSYLAEAALHGTGCENKWERPAYQTSGRC